MKHESMVFEPRVFGREGSRTRHSIHFQVVAFVARALVDGVHALHVMNNAIQ